MNYSRNKVIVGLVLVAGIMLAGITVRAAVLIEWQDGTDGAADREFVGWSSMERYTGVSGGPEEFNIVNLGTELQLNPDTGNSPATDIHFTTAANLGGTAGSSLNSWGDSQTDMAYIQMDFTITAGGAPDSLGFYFADTGGNTWYYDINTSALNSGVNTVAASLDYSAGWYGWDTHTWGGTVLDETAFNNDLGTADFVDQIGIWIAYDADNSAQDYRIDNFGLAVPEPETYLILGMALLSVVIVFRKRITESLSEARAMMQI